MTSLLMLVFCSCTQDKATKEVTSEIAPVIDQLSLGSYGIQIESPMRVHLRCRHCDENNAQFEWYIEGNPNPVSNEDYYQMESGDLYQEVSIHATAFSSSGVPSSTEIVSYRRRFFSDVAGGSKAFTLLTTEGEVLTWDQSDGYGYKSNIILESGSSVRKIYSNSISGVALHFNNELTTWNYEPQFSNSDVIPPPEKIENVSSIHSTIGAFAALKHDGSVVTWGLHQSYVDGYGVPRLLNYGADSSSMQNNLEDVVDIVSTRSAFAALKADGTVISWGDTLSGGDSRSVADELTDIVSIFADQHNFLAKKSDGSFIAWGMHELEYSSMLDQLGGIISLTGNRYSSIAKFSDGSAIIWNLGDYGESSENVSDRFTDIFSTVVSGDSIAVLKLDGTIVVWGYSDRAEFGADISEVVSELYDIVSIASIGRGFSALRTDGQVISWGGEDNGHLAHLYQDLSGITQIFSLRSGTFVGIKEDGSVICWGVDRCYPELTELTSSTLKPASQ